MLMVLSSTLHCIYYYAYGELFSSHNPDICFNHDNYILHFAAIATFQSHLQTVFWFAQEHSKQVVSNLFYRYESHRWDCSSGEYL